MARLKSLPAVLAVLAVLVVPGPSVHGQTPRTGRVMRTKLAHTQRILEALMTSDYAMLERESVALSRVTETPEWAELKTAELKAFTDNFLRATHDLAEAARQRDLDAAAVRYGALTMACYRCHQYRKGARIAR